MKTKNQLFIELKAEALTNRQVKSYLRKCDSLTDIKQSICWDLNFAKTIISQLDGGKTMQWYQGETYFANKSEIKDLQSICYYIAKKLGYEIEHNTNGYHYIGKISGY